MTSKIGVEMVLVSALLLVAMGCGPPWYRAHESRLISDDAAERGAAVEALAAEGERAMPLVQEWLRSQRDDYIIGACLVLEKMEGDVWKKALPELEEILQGSPSARTNAAAAVVYRKNYACECKLSIVESTGDVPIVFIEGISWKHYSDDPAIKRNICLFIIESESNQDIRSVAVAELSFTDSLAVAPLIAVLKNDSKSCLHSAAAYALGIIGDKKAVEPLIKALNDTVSDVRWGAASALGKINDARAVAPLIKVLADEDSFVRRAAVEALGEIRNKSAIAPLIEALKDKDEKVCSCAAVALANITKQDFGEDYTKWKEWYEKSKEK
jgi:hypothetical protein